MKTRTDLGFIRTVLDQATETNGHVAAKTYGLSPKTVYRWLHYRDEHPEWPTDEQIAEHRDAAARLGEKRARDAALHRSYMKRRYLARGERMTVPAIGTTRRLQALFALGWTSTDLAARLGVGNARIGHLATDGRQQRVLRTTAAQVAALYDELCMTIPQDPDILPSPRHCRVHDRQRRIAVRNGWVPPLAWDDIDDPDEQPGEWRYTPAARGEALTELVDRGAGITEVCAALRVSREALEKWCARHGRQSEFSALVSRETWSEAS